MRAFHIDHEFRLSGNGELLTLSNNFPFPWYTHDIRELCDDLFDGQGVSGFGANFLDSVPIADPFSFPPPRASSDVRNLLIEYCFEVVRRKHFLQCPSRFQSLFACASLEDVASWKTAVPSLNSGQVWLVEADSGFLANAALLKATHYEGSQEFFDPALARSMALAYWGTGKWLVSTFDASRGDRAPEFEMCASFPAALCGTQAEKPQAEILLKLPARILRKV